VTKRCFKARIYISIYRKCVICVLIAKIARCWGLHRQTLLQSCIRQLRALSPNSQPLIVNIWFSVGKDVMVLIFQPCSALAETSLERGAIMGWYFKRGYQQGKRIRITDLGVNIIIISTLVEWL